jgi:hypothetical protein
MALSFLWRGAPGGILTPLMRRLFPHALKVGCCPRCGIQLYPDELTPEGRASRCMCEPCYNQMIPGVLSEVCMVCGRRLPKHKIMMQKESPREVEAKLHDGDCMARWSIVHNVTNGEVEVVEAVKANLRNVRREYQPAGMLSAPEQGYAEVGYAEAGYIEAEYYEVPAGDAGYDRYEPLGLPEPQPQETIEIDSRQVKGDLEMVKRLMRR